MGTIRLICRNSRLAVIQAQEVISGLQEYNFQLKFIASYGDKNKHISLVDNAVSDFFTRELDEALLKNEADIAVHSAKDLPYPLPEGLEVIALTSGLSNADALVSKNKKKILELPAGSKVGTSSAERKKQVVTLRPDLELVEVRGNIDERLALIDAGKIDALIVAECALQRLSYEHLISEVLPFKTHPLQGNLAVVAKKGNPKLKSIFYPLDIRKDFGKITFASYIHGHPEYLTLKALNALSNAGIICYDSNVDLAFIKSFTSEKIYLQSEEIAETIYSTAKSGKKVCFLVNQESFEKQTIELTHFFESRMLFVEKIPGVNQSFKIPVENTILADKRNKVLVTEAENKDYEHLGETINYSSRTIKPIEDFRVYKEIFSEKEPFNFLIFQSKETINFFIKALVENKKDLRWIANSKIIAVGLNVSQELLKYGLNADLIIKDQAKQSVIDFFIERQLPGRRILMIKETKSSETEISLLKRMGYFVVSMELYERIVQLYQISNFNLDEIDIIAFSSPLGVKQFKEKYSKLPQHISVISDGEDTRRSLYDTGLLSYEPEWVI